MDKLIISGKNKIKGSIKIHGSKNSALPIIVSSLLSEKDLKLYNLPKVEDINNMLKLIKLYGVRLTKSSNSILLNSRNLKNISADYDIVRKMRASFLILGPLLARFGQGTVALPGGCAIGARPVDIHLMALEALGARFSIDNGYVIGKVSGCLKGSRIKFPFSSVGATANTIMAAVLAKGTTELVNVAREPEIVDLCKCLKSMGCKIEGEGENTIVIEGVSNLRKTSHEVVMDRIELGTYIIAGAISDGEINLTGGNSALLESFIDKLSEVGVEVNQTSDHLSVRRTKSSSISSTNIVTEPFPGFPTDLQAQMMALLSIADGVSNIEEKIFENRILRSKNLIFMIRNKINRKSMIFVRIQNR